MDTRRRWTIALLFLALVTRVGSAVVIGDGFHFPDEGIYVDAARRLSDGAGFGASYQNVPGYPVVLAVLSLGGRTSVTVLRLAQGAVAALGCLLVFGLADRLFGQRVAIVAGLIYAVDPLLVLSSGLLYPESIAALVVPLLVMAAYDGADQDLLWRTAMAGALLGVLALLRPVALILVPVVAVWVWLASAVGRPRRLAHLGALGLAFLAVITPWTLRNLLVHGRLVPVATAGTQVGAVREQEVQREGVAQSLVGVASSDPLAFAADVGRQFIQFWELTPSRLSTDDPVKRERFHEIDERLSTQPLFPRALRDWVSALTFGLELGLALLGLAVATRGRWRPASLPLALTLAYAFGYALFVSKLRYRIPILPLVFTFAGAGAVFLFSRLHGPGRTAQASPS